MPAVFAEKKMRQSILTTLALTTLAAALIGASLNPPTISAQEPPSIIGSRPLDGLSGATDWLNSKPLTAKDLKGKVVVIDFWAYSCINCIRSVPYIRAWADKYKNSGLVVIGVHTPEFDFEKQLPNVQRAVRKFNMTYPIALDSNYAVWNAFHNQYWPAHYFLDATGKVRYEHFGEGEYDQSERWIQELLKEANAKSMPTGAVTVQGQGVEAAGDLDHVRSPETYIGYSRAAHFGSPDGMEHDREKRYSIPDDLRINEWALEGPWIDHKQDALLKAAGGKIAFRFFSRDLHLVLGPSSDGKQIRFRVTIDGHAPGEDRGVDIDAQGNGTVTEHRLYQLVRLKGPVKDHVFVIEFLDPGVQAFSFTFG